MNIDAKCKKCRRAGEKLFLKGDRCYTPKCAMVKRNYPPGAHGQKRRPRLSSYGVHLQEKQKVRHMYGLSEAQFKGYMKKAMAKKGNTGDIFLQFLERRLDNVIYRLGMAKSRIQARKTVNHGHFLVNNKKVNIPSYLLDVKDIITIREKSMKNKYFLELIKSINKHEVPEWMSLDKKTLKGQFVNLPDEKQLNLGIQTQLIVEFYSK